VKKLLLFFMVAGALIWACAESSAESRSRYTPPDDHNISKQGAMHKPGLESPLEDCTDCHGADLRGDMVQVSCYTCHGETWK